MLILILAAFLVLVPQISHSDCLDYGDYIDRLGSTDTPGWEEDVAISGTRAYVVTRTYAAGWSSGLRVLDLSNPAAPVLLGSLELPGEAYAVAVSGTFAYVTNSNYGLRVIDVSNPNSPTIVGTADTPVSARAVALVGTRAYVTDGTNIHMIDVSNPTSPTIIATANAPAAALDVAVVGTTLYVAANTAGLVIIDWSNLALPARLGSVNTPGQGTKVAVSGTVALLGDGDGGTAVIDVSNSYFPSLMRTISGHVYDVAFSESGVALMATDWEGLVTFDITNTVMGNIEMIETNGRAWAIGVSAGLACVAKRSNWDPQEFTGIDVFDASNAVFPPSLGLIFGTGTVDYSLAIDGTKIYITGRKRNASCPVYPAPLCQSSFAVVDASNPHSPVTLGTVDTPGEIDGVAASGSTAYVACGYSGLQVINVSNPASPTIVGTAITGYALDVAVSGTKTYVAGSDAVYVVDVSNTSAPVILGSLSPGATSIAVSGSIACATSSGLQVIDVSSPSHPRILGSVDTPGNATDVALSGSLAYVTDDDPGAGFQVIDLSNPRSPTVLATLALTGIASGIAVSGTTAYVADGTQGLQVIDISNPSSPVIIGRGFVYTPRKIAASDQFLCITAGNYPPLFPLQCPTPPVVQNPGTQNGTEQAYFSMTLTATDADQWGLALSPVGSIPAWATFTDQGGGTAHLTGIPQPGQAGTYPVSIRASDDKTSTTVSFNIVIAPAGQTGIDGSIPRFRLAASPNPFRSEIDVEFELER